MLLDYVRASYRAEQYYANATTGDDNNDGRDVTRPVKTLQKLLQITPDNIHYWSVWNLVGEFLDPGPIYIAKTLAPWEGDILQGILIDGGDNWETIAGPFTSDISSQLTIGDSGQAWVANTYRPYAVRVTSGAANGQRRKIQSNNGTTITVCAGFSVDPGAGATFVIEQPATKIKTTTSTWQSFYASANGTGRITLQRLTFEGTKLNVGSVGGSALHCQISHCVFKNLQSFGFNTTAPISLGRYRDPANPGSYVSSTTSNVGMGVNGVYMSVTGNNAAESSFVVSTVPEYRHRNGILGHVSQGTLFGKMILYKVRNIESDYTQIDTTAGNYSDTIIEGSDAAGITAVECNLKFGATFADQVKIQNNATHGIDAFKSWIKLTGYIGGGGNVKYGVKAEQSVIAIKNGEQPPITGLLGDFSSDGTNPLGTWAEVDGGTQCIDLDRQSYFVENEGIVGTPRLSTQGKFASLSASQIVETDASSKLISAAKGTAYNKAFGSGAGTVCEGNDARLSDARTPTAHNTSHQNGGADEINVAGLNGVLADAQTPSAHNTSHQSGGGDSIKLDDLAAPDDNTDLNASTAKHGLCPKLPNDAAKYLDGTGNYTVPAGGGGGADLMQVWAFGS